MSGRENPSRDRGTEFLARLRPHRNDLRGSDGSGEDAPAEVPGPGPDAPRVPPPLRSPARPGARDGTWSGVGERVAPGTGPAQPPVPSGPRLRVDWPNCKGHGLCHELLPEIVHPDEWGYPVIDDHPVPAELIGIARKAVTTCPTLALRLVGMP